MNIMRLSQKPKGVLVTPPDVNARACCHVILTGRRHATACSPVYSMLAVCTIRRATTHKGSRAVLKARGELQGGDGD